ncbi:DUF4132 domain-containing protein [Virgisporangium aurantiacum]|uniref:DUF4132 domain-containing protein n=1 Tax=Virgisporangium aurantiacum TaxID=175570 RepID=A0A8J3ZBM1_9ACTN|nr:DUF4132 domain-containing protein [Virgisporangium aurantiacum]GIJ61004.1 hypothetical protein Vau01_085200 [Virgisporangium aurantiacum]
MSSWIQLLPPLSEAVREEYERLVADAGEAAGRALAAVRYRPDETDVKRVTKVWSREKRRLAALRLHADAVRTGSEWARPHGRAIDLLARHGAAWNRADLVWSLHLLAASEARHDDASVWQLPAAAASRLDGGSLRGLREVLSGALSELTVSGVEPNDRRDLGDRIGEGLGRLVVSPVPWHLLHAGDAFGPAAREDLAEVLAAPGVPELLLHAASLTRPVPPAKWSAAAEPLFASAGDAARAVLRRFVAYGGYVHQDTDGLLRGLVCALDRDPSDAATALIGEVAQAAGDADRASRGYPYAPKTAAAAVEILAGRGGDGPVRVLGRLSLGVKNKALLTRVHAGLARLGALRGWQPGEVLELAVDDHGLDRDGRRTWEIDGYTAVVEVGDGRAALRFEKDGRSLKGVPAAVRPAPLLAKVKAVVKEIGGTLAAERARVEALLSADRDWDFADWVTRYLEHPVTGVFGRRLIWQVDGVGGIPVRGGAGWTLAERDAGRVRLWHPVLAPVDEVVGWRDHVTAAGLRQPFKQAFREIYLLTPAERQTDVYSNRFAAHILRYRQANALFRTRGWHADYLGPWDGGYEGEATKEFAGGWRAAFLHEMAGQPVAPHYTVEHCVTDQVRFARRDGAVWDRAALAEVPPRVFSEAMRDVDLFVGVTSIGTDDAWVDRGDHRFFPYWAEASVGGLTARAEVRRDVLARILPKLAIGDRCELQERFLRVRGTLRTYRIHLGSANILMEPDDAYLCIVPGRGTGEVWLPFDDDPTLSVILSKAIMLAADGAITDRGIVDQIRSGGR